jgi:hypothetical protein
MLCIIYSRVIDVIISTLISLLAAYIFLLLIKYSMWKQIKTSLGTYNEDGYEKSKFAVSANKINNLTLFSRFQIEIKRTSSPNDEMNWKGVFYSDMLNPYHFQGIYITDKSPGNKDGWMDVHIFRSEEKIALKLHFINNERRWVENQGYFIIKDKKG